ncbi:hypothetical protein N7522_005302, partial [Penicillium canescens]
MAGHDTPLSRAQPWLGRCPHTLGSNEASVFSGAPGQPVMESHAPHPLKDKVAIPRGLGPGIPTSNKRVNRACDSCREQKAKCSGHRPACQRCRQSDITCIYADKKRERDAKQSADLRSRIREYEELLRTLHPRLDRQMATEVEKVIGGVGDQDRSFPLGGSGGTQLPATSPMTPRPSPVKEGQQATNNPVQPTDHTTEDLNRDGDTRATGLVGRPSEIAWLNTLQTEPNTHSKIARSSGRSGYLPPLSTNYFLDNMQILVPDLNDYPDRPSKDAATQLVGSYFQNVHASFPFVGKPIFLEQFRCYYANSGAQPGRKWMAVLNLIFAIASRHSSLVKKESGADMSYFTRAWKLYAGGFAVLDRPSLQQVQIESLISLYLLSLGHINRAWRMCSIAMRSAVAIGVHLRTENAAISSISKETRYRLWWALYSLDVQLCLMTGRPLNMDLRYCTTPLPVPYHEEDFLDGRVAQIIANEDIRKALVSFLIPRAAKPDSGDQQRFARSLPSAVMEGGENDPDASSVPESIKPNTSLYFLCRVGLACIGRTAMDEIHSSSTALLSWDEVETSITRNNASADGWLAQLPSYYNFDKSSPNCPFVRQRTSLAFRFYSIKLIILEPCLRRVIRVSTEGPCSVHCQTMAAICMQVARSVLDILPDEPDVSWLYEYCPWWSILHYIMQCSTILMVSLAGQVELGSIRLEETVRYIRKACRWLHEMSRTDDFSRRAWSIFLELAAFPIPRATNQMNAVTPGRVKQACQSCREQKAKCSGHRPQCRRCEENSLFCVYEDRERFKMTKQLHSLANQVQTYESLLREIYPKLGFEVANSVDHVFGSKYRDHPRLEKVNSISASIGGNFDSLSSSKDPAHVFHEADCQGGSDASLPAVVADCTTENYNQKGESQAMGYVGDHSAMKWLYRLKCHLDDNNRNSNVKDDSYDNFDFARGKFSSVNYYLDDVKLRFPEDADISRRPPQTIADHLVSAYFGVTHVYFPFIRKEIFLSQYRSFYSDQTAKPGRRWLAIFNLVLAVAAAQSCAMSKGTLPESPEVQECNAHNTFFGRGWNLALTDSVLEPSNLQQVQVEGLASLYLLSAGHAIRAWKLCGVATRSAITMGLHLRSESNTISPISKQSRYQLWWALQMLDTKLCATIGRPLSMDIAFFTTPAPSPYGDMDLSEERSTPIDLRMISADLLASDDFSHPTLFESPTYQAFPLRRTSHAETRGEPNPQKAVGKLMTTNSLRFIYAIQLNHIMRQAIIGIYTTSARKSRQHLESVIRSLNSSADHWLSSLPSTCRFLRTEAADQLDCHRTSLAFSFYCTKILILQPCLHIATCQSSDKNLPNSFCASMAALCIRMAKETIDIFPDEPDTAWLSTSCPWWCALHYLMQSTAILMIALFKGTQIITADAINVQFKVHKAVRWLRAMSTGDPVAQKASNLCQDILANHSVGAA